MTGITMNYVEDGSDKSKQTVNLNRRSAYRMESKITHLNKEFRRSYAHISKEQETLLKKQKKKIFLPLIHDIGSSQSDVSTRLATWNKDLMADYQTKARLAAAIPLPPYYTHVTDEVLRTRIYNFLYGANLKIRQKEKQRLHLPKIRFNGSPASQAQYNWQKIRENLKFLILVEKQIEDEEMTEFEFEFRKLRACRYLRQSKRQLTRLDDYNQSSNYRCFCNSCVLNIIKTNEMNDGRSKETPSLTTSSSSHHTR